MYVHRAVPAGHAGLNCSASASIHPNDTILLNYLFVYGTLRKTQNGNLHPYLKNHAVFIDRASLPGKLYQVEHYPGAIPAPLGSQGLIYGEVYRLLQPEAVLSILDEYEECASHFPQPHEYRRAPETVILSNEKRLRAWVYWFCHPVSGLPQISSGDYFDYLFTTNSTRKSI